MKVINVCLGLLFAVLLGWQVHQYLPFQLCQLEHTHMFLEDWDWFLSHLEKMGGLAQWIGDYGIQYFNPSVTGSLVFVLPVWLLFAVTTLLVKGQERSLSVSMPLALWPSVCQLASLYDYNFYWSGAVALVSALSILWLVSLIRMYSVRSVVFLLSIPMVMWLFGSVVAVYVIGGACLFFTKKNWLQSVLAPLLLWVGMVLLAYHQDWFSSLQASVSPLMYYEVLLEFPLHHWLTWGSVSIVLCLARFLPVIMWRNKIVVYGLAVLGWALPCVVLAKGAPKCLNQSNLDLFRLNHYAYTEDWDGILNFLKGRPVNNYLFMNYANMALAEKGELGNRAFHFYPRGINSLLVTANSTGSVRMLLSDVNYSVGCIAEAQQHAFEGQVTFSNSLGIQTMKRLVKTNLIFGHYEVAEKYLSLIAKTTFHKEWAKKYMDFLYKDDAVEKDEELGEKRRGLSLHNRFAMFYGWRPELEDIVEVNPENDKALAYLGISYLLSKDLEGFRVFMDKYYGQKDMKDIPMAFQQGKIMLCYQDKQAWENAGFSTQVVKEFKQYLALYAQNRQRPNLKNVMHRSFGHTFWYYLMFV